MGTMEWSIIAGAVFVVGTAIGFLLAKLLQKTDSAKLSEVEAELEDYRARVTEHFSESAAHFQAIGRQYRELYEHMAEGSEKLCAPDQAKAELNFPRPGDIQESTDEPDTPESSREASTGETTSDEPVKAQDGEQPKTDGKTRQAADAEAVKSSEKSPESSPESSSETSPESAADKPSPKADTLASTEEQDVDPGKRLYH